MKKKSITGVLIGAVLFHTTVVAQPASTEFVKSAVDGLRSEILTQVNTVQTQVNTLPIVTHHIGERFQGGMVFWVDSSLQHGLMVSLHDLTPSEGIEWRNGEGGDRVVNAKGLGLGSGETNTRLIISEQTIDDQEGRFAALLASNYQVSVDGTPCPEPITASSTCIGGWYLPSIYELMLLHKNLKQINPNHEVSASYWSSSEHSTTDAWLLDFNSGEALITPKASKAHVRAIHSF
ncbi:TPA: DUF1566 domain-containing protein [Legionella pneumophila]|nr:DUF1566 domain-containing protein [Legionella pneumophila]HDS3863215.1 DUF1566 domain-containing protein [Legionella pneumophila]